MADNTQLSAGTGDGAVIATDAIGAAPEIHYQLVKQVFGPLDTATLVTTSAGLPVQQQGTWDIGTVTAVTAITNALPAGDNNIGNVDIVTVPADPFGANADAASATGSISAKLRYIAAGVAADGHVQVDVLSAPSTAVTNAGITTIAGAVAGTEMQVDIVSIAAGDNNIGNVDLVTLPAANLSQRASAASLSVTPATDVADATYIGDIKFGEALPAGTNALGKLLPPDIDITTHANYIKKYYTNTGAVTDGIVWSPAAGKRWHVVSLYFETSAAATVTFEDDLAGGDSAVLAGDYAANAGAVIHFGEKYPLASGEDAADLTVTTSAGNIFVTAVGYEV